MGTRAPPEVAQRYDLSPSARKAAVALLDTAFERHDSGTKSQIPLQFWGCAAAEARGILCGGNPDVETLTKPRFAHRWRWMAVGGLLGLAGSMLGSGPTGCIYPDTCIKVTSPGHDWCRHLANAVQWPIDGSLEDAMPVLDPGGNTPRGCVCFNDAEHQILDDEVPECPYAELLDELEQAARQECQTLVLPGYEHNCWTTTGPDASTPEVKFSDGQGGCIGNCEYGAPPSNGSCPDPNPYQCGTGDGGYDCESKGDADAPTADDESSGAELIDLELAISCEGFGCEIDRTFARQLYDDPSPLLAEGVQLVYDRPIRRHAFSGITPGTTLHTLGIRSGDQLERIGSTVIDDLDAALRAYVENHDTNPLEVRVKRGDQWVNFTYTFVP